MRICNNGTYRDMTPEEVEAWKAAQEQTPPPPPTVDALEAAIKEGLQL